MTFAEAQIADLDAVLLSFETSEYVTIDGAEIPAIVTYQTEADKQAGLVTSDASVVVRRSDIPAPSVNDYVAIGGATYRVGQITDEDPLLWTLEINKWS